MSKMPKISIRFDVDTPKCLAEGVPNLLTLAETYNVKFTFFINTGKSISRKNLTQKLFRKTNAAPQNVALHLTAFDKLGPRSLIELLLFNRNVLDGNEKIVEQATELGHEIGLHGGRNHALWEEESLFWKPDKIENEIAWGLERLKSIAPNIKGFSSPCWVTPDCLTKILKAYDFKYLANAHGKAIKCSYLHGNGLYEIATQLTAEPGGVAFFENLEASRLTKKCKESKIIETLSSINENTVVYDHPYFSGVHDIQTLDFFIRTAGDMGFNIVPMEELISE